MFGDRVHSAELLRDGVVRMCGQNPELTASDGAKVNVAKACEVLRDWDMKADIGSHGTPLWHEFYTRAQEAEDLYLVPYDPAKPVSTPNTLNQASPVTRAALADAVQVFGKLGLPLDTPLGKVLRTGTGSIPVHGCPGSDGCFNVINPTEGTLGEHGYGDVRHGTSFVLAVQFTDAGPRSSTITAYSQSANPASPQHTDQTRLYARKGWITGRFTAKEIAAAPGARSGTVRG